jgi:hypothetical protein
MVTTRGQAKQPVPETRTGKVIPRSEASRDGKASSNVYFDYKSRDSHGFATPLS